MSTQSQVRNQHGDTTYSGRVAEVQRHFEVVALADNQHSGAQGAIRNSSQDSAQRVHKLRAEQNVTVRVANHSRIGVMLNVLEHGTQNGRPIRIGREISRHLNTQAGAQLCDFVLFGENHHFHLMQQRERPKSIQLNVVLSQS